MPAPLITEEWIGEQLALCKAEAATRQKEGGLPHPYKYPVRYAYLSAAREGYPLVLKRLQQLENLLVAVDKFLSHSSLSYDEVVWTVSDYAVDALDCARAAAHGEEERDASTD